MCAGEPGAEIIAGAAALLFVTDLERSHHELRAALILAGKEIRKLNFGRKDTPVLQLLRRALREARSAREPSQQSTSRPRIDG